MSFRAGFTSARKLTGHNANNLRAHRVQNGYAQAMFKGDVVRVSSGNVKIVTGTAGTWAPVGVLEGFAWIDDVSRQPVYSNARPASVSSANGRLEGFDMARGHVAFVNDDPNTTYIVASDVSITETLVGRFARVTAGGTGSLITGQSNARLDADTGVSAANAVVRVINVVPIVATVSAGQTVDGTFENTPATARTLVEVVLVNHIYG